MIIWPINAMAIPLNFYLDPETSVNELKLLEINIFIPALDV